MPTGSGSNKRLYERVRIDSSNRLWNLSEGGAYLATDEPKRLGSTLAFELKLEKDQPHFKALAKVIRVIHKPNPKTGEPAGMALQFLQVSEDDKKRLQQYLITCKQRARIEGNDVPPFHCPDND